MRNRPSNATAKKLFYVQNLKFFEQTKEIQVESTNTMTTLTAKLENDDATTTYDRTMTILVAP